MLLAAEGIVGGYGEIDILHGVDLTVDEREIVAVAGTNGAGKSTLAKALMGLLPRMIGRIALAGRDITRVAAEDRVALGIAYVPQVANVFGALTVHENLRVVPHVAADRIGEVLELFPALGKRLRQRAATLSGGERQQLAFARALMTRPSLVVLDEPTAALAPPLVRFVFDLVRQLPAQGVAVLMVEQRARHALAIADRGVILDQGRAVLAGRASDLLADPRMAELYLGHAH